MGEYVGEVGKRMTFEVTYVRSFEYVTHFGYREITNYIHSFSDSDGNTLVWKTTNLLGFDEYNQKRDCYDWKPITQGSVIKLTGSVKEHSEYKGTKQTVLQRCKISVITLADTWEEKRDKKRKEQLDSLAEGDFVWEIPYRQYKEHYSDCETVYDSFDKEERTIQVIIRAGRLKNSGVRGKHYSGYQFLTEDGKKVCYRAISEDTARKQLLKDYPNGGSWECVHIFNYNVYRYF